MLDSACRIAGHRWKEDVGRGGKDVLLWAQPTYRCFPAVYVLSYIKQAQALQQAHAVVHRPNVITAPRADHLVRFGSRCSHITASCKTIQKSRATIATMPHETGHCAAGLILST